MIAFIHDKYIYIYKVPKVNIYFKRGRTYTVMPSREQKLTQPHYVFNLPVPNKSFHASLFISSALFSICLQQLTICVCFTFTSRYITQLGMPLANQVGWPNE